MTKSLSLPAAMAVLAILSRNSTTYESEVEDRDHPIRRTIESILLESAPNFKGDKDLQSNALAIDALASFLPTEEGQAYAMALETGGSTIRLLVAGNNVDSHLQASDERELTGSASQFLKAIWLVMRAISEDTAAGVRHQVARDKLAFLLLDRAFIRMKERFKKDELAYLAFDKLLDVGTLDPSVSAFLIAARRIYTSQSQFLNSSEATEQQARSYFDCMNEAVTLYWSAKKAEGLRVKLKTLVIQLEWKTRAGELETSVAEALDPQFDVLRYFDDLCSPFLHAVLLGKTARKYGTLFTSDVDVVEVPHDTNTLPSSIDLPTDKVQQFLLKLIGGDAKDWTGRYIVDEKVRQVSEAGRDLQAVATPHSGARLLSFLHQNQDIYTPERYIGTTEVCCLQCALYVGVYKSHLQTTAPDQTPFCIRGARFEAILPVALPNCAEDKWGRFAENKIMATVKKTIRGVLREEIEELQMLSAYDGPPEGYEEFERPRVLPSWVTVLPPPEPKIGIVCL